MIKGSHFIKYTTRAVAGIVILALAITVFLQNRRISALAGEDNKYLQEEIEKYKAEIDRLKSQIADMQEWQDYLEGTLKENNNVPVRAPVQQNNPAEIRNRLAENLPRIMDNPAIRDGMRTAISSRYDALAEEIGLSEEKKSKLTDLLSEMQQEIMRMMPGSRGFPPDMVDRDELRQQIEEISSTYNKKLSEILSDDELSAFREYQHSEQERMMIMGFNSTDGLQLDKETEKELVAAMYSARQTDPDTKREDDSLSLMGDPIGRGPMRGGFENSEKLTSVYLESAKEILSDDEMQKFEEYLNTRQSAFNMRRAPTPDRTQSTE